MTGPEQEHAERAEAFLTASVSSDALGRRDVASSERQHALVHAVLAVAEAIRERPAATVAEVTAATPTTCAEPSAAGVPWW